MKYNKRKIEIISILISILALGISGVALLQGWDQNSISKQAFDISNYVEVFVFPENVRNITDNGWVKFLIFKVKNMSNYPIYINSYTIDNMEIIIGNSPIPNNEAVGWYEIQVPSEILNKKKDFNVDLLYEDYFGRRYKSHIVAKFVSEYDYWSVTQEKSIKLETDR